MAAYRGIAPSVHRFIGPFGGLAVVIALASALYTQFVEKYSFIGTTWRNPALVVLGTLYLSAFRKSLKAALFGGKTKSKL